MRRPGLRRNANGPSGMRRHPPEGRWIVGGEKAGRHGDALSTTKKPPEIGRRWLNRSGTGVDDQPCRRRLVKRARLPAQRGEGTSAPVHGISKASDHGTGLYPFGDGRETPRWGCNSALRHATSSGVMNPRLEMPTRWARFVVGAIPRTTMAIFVTEIARATPFGNFHDRAVSV